jgi:hypothetical protein
MGMKTKGSLSIQHHLLGLVSNFIKMLFESHFQVLLLHIDSHQLIYKSPDFTLMVYRFPPSRRNERYT